MSNALYIVLEVALDWWGSMNSAGLAAKADDWRRSSGMRRDVFQEPNSAIAARYLVYFLKASFEQIIIRYSDNRVDVNSEKRKSSRDPLSSS